MPIAISDIASNRLPRWFLKLAILDDWFDTLRGLPCYKKLNEIDVTVFTDHVQDTAILSDRLKEFDALVLFRERTSISAELLDQLPNLKLISQRSVYPHIDVEACSRNNVLLCSSMHTGLPSFAAAEHTWGLILASMRQIPQQMQSLQLGNWQMGVGKTLHGRTLGLYGYGRISKAVNSYAKAFGMNVIWWASDEGRKRAELDGHKVSKSRSSFFSEADVVSVHVRLKPNTHEIIKDIDFKVMGKDALFVNTSRAKLIVPGALLDALNNGRPGQAAIDVFDQEPITDNKNELVNHPNIICTPHIGFVTEDEFELQFSDIFEQVIKFKEGKPINVINAILGL